MKYFTLAFTPSASPQQQTSARLIERFNKRELLWRSLEGRRRLRRKLSRKSAALLTAMDLNEFDHKLPPEDCIGRRA